MRKSALFALFTIFIAAGAMAQVLGGAVRLRAEHPDGRRLEVNAPFQVALQYVGQTYILTGRSDKSLWHQVYAPAALGNTLPDETLDVTRGPATLIIRWGDGTVSPIRFYPLDDAVNPGAILPFDPWNPAPTPLFTPGEQVDGLLLDCPIQGIPNDASVQSVVAYRHYVSYIVVQGRYYALGGTPASSQSVATAAIDGPDGFRMVLMDHYRDRNGAWYVPATECIRDANGNIITTTGGGRRHCEMFQ